MAFPCTSTALGALVVIWMVSLLHSPAYAGNFNKNFHITWGDGRAKILDGGKQLTLSLDKASGSGFESKSQYLFGKFDMRLKLVPGNSAGTVTTFFLSSLGADHDEIDFEFLGNMSGQPYSIHTNVYSQGKGNREQQFRLWFDPTADFHTYSITWNPHHIIFSVDGRPLRESKNWESIGVPYPKKKEMKIYSSLWNADDWATMGGAVKTDWSKAPFVASYGDFSIRGCKWVPANKTYSCTQSPHHPKGIMGTTDEWMVGQNLDNVSQKQLKMVQRKYMIYNYCTYNKRFPQGLPPECSRS